LAPEQLAGHGEAVGLDMAAFTTCLESGGQADEVRQDLADGGAAGVTGTPTFFLAVAGDEPGTLRTLVKISGAQPFAVFKTAIDQALAELAKG
jgi:predicted DsbA family dithiol-disulfide isomerase